MPKQHVEREWEYRGLKLRAKASTLGYAVLEAERLADQIVEWLY